MSCTDLATTATFKEIETPSSESEQKAEQVQLLVTPEGNTIPEEKPECTLGLMKHLSADGTVLYNFLKQCKFLRKIPGWVHSSQ